MMSLLAWLDFPCSGDSNESNWELFCSDGLFPSQYIDIPYQIAQASIPRKDDFRYSYLI